VTLLSGTLPVFRTANEYVITSPSSTGCWAFDVLTTLTAGAGVNGVLAELVAVGAGIPGGGVPVTVAVFAMPKIRSVNVVG